MRASARLARAAMALGAAAALSLAAPLRPSAQDTGASDSPAAALQGTSQASALADSHPEALRPRAPALRPALQPVAPPPPVPAGPAPRLAAQAPIPDAELEAFVDGLVRQAMVRDHIPGAAVSVVQNGRVALAKGYGVSSLSPARAVDPGRTLFRLGQASELFTWIAVMKQVERGRMRLDAPVNLYLPETLQVRDQGYQRQVLLRDLMNHASGFESRALGRLYERDPGRVRPLAKYLRQERPRRMQAQGVLPEYTAYDAALAGAALVQVTGKPFEDLLEQDVLRPAGLDRTTFREPYPADKDLPAPMPADLAGDVSQGFHWSGDTYRAAPFEYSSQIAPAGSASATAGDMGRLMLLMLAGGTLDGRTVYGAQTATLLRTVAQRSGPGIDGLAYGVLQYRLPAGLTGYGQQGETLAFNCDLVMVPELNLGVFIADNARGGQVLADELPGLIVQRFYAPPPALPTVSAELARRGSAYAGTYLNERRRYGGLEQFVSLIRDEAQVEALADGRLVVHGPDGAGAWAPQGDEGQFREADGWRTAGFQLQDGAAVRWLPPSGVQTFARIGLLWQTRTLAVLSALTLIAAAATLIGLATRDRRDFRETSIQGRASALQTSTAVLWFVAAGAFLAWGVRAAGDVSVLYLDWPSPWVLVASACALVAAACSLGQLILLPGIWRGGRRVDSWTAGRKLRFSVTTLLFLAYAVLLGMWGALEPWSA